MLTHRGKNGWSMHVRGFEEIKWLVLWWFCLGFSPKGKVSHFWEL
jgi:hypothetical protein